MSDPETAREYSYYDAQQTHAHSYLMPIVDSELAAFAPRSVFDLGCGNGSAALHFARKYEVVGVDTSESGIAQANLAFPGLRLETGSVYDDLAAKYGQFDAVVSLEVVEHLIAPRVFAQRMFALVRTGGHIIVSTPYHGYLKNLVLAAAGKLDAHFTALWDGGHIKFWSVKTITALLREAGFQDIRFRYAGRIPPLAKSMIAIARRPQT